MATEMTTKTVPDVLYLMVRKLGSSYRVRQFQSPRALAKGFDWFHYEKGMTFRTLTFGDIPSVDLTKAVYGAPRTGTDKDKINAVESAIMAALIANGVALGDTGA